MSTLACIKPARRSRRNAPPGTARNNAHRALADKLLGLVVGSLKERRRATGPTHHSSGLRHALPSGPFPPYPVPLGDRRSSLSGDPSARRLPEMPPDPAKRPPGPATGSGTSNQASERRIRHRSQSGRSVIQRKHEAKAKRPVARRAAGEWCSREWDRVTR